MDCQSGLGEHDLGTTLAPPRYARWSAYHVRRLILDFGFPQVALPSPPAGGGVTVAAWHLLQARGRLQPQPAATCGEWRSRDSRRRERGSSHRRIFGAAAGVAASFRCIQHCSCFKFIVNWRLRAIKASWLSGRARSFQPAAARCAYSPPGHNATCAPIVAVGPCLLPSALPARCSSRWQLQGGSAPCLARLSW